MAAAYLLSKKIAEPVEIFPKGADVQLYRTGAVRFPQLPYPTPRKHERDAATVVSLDAVESAADRREEGREKQVVRDYRGTGSCRMVFFGHLIAFRGGIVQGRFWFNAREAGNQAAFVISGYFVEPCQYFFVYLLYAI